MRVQKKPKAFAYRGTIADYNYLQCTYIVNHFYNSRIEETKRYGAMIKACHVWYQIVDEI